MTETFSTTFTVDSWDEAPIDDIEDGAGKVTLAKVTKTYAGDFEATSLTEWVMAYAEDGTASFVGFERIAGTIGGHDGAIVLQHVGGFEDDAAVAAVTVFEGGGTGALAGTTGEGDFRADPSGTLTLRLSFA